MLNRTRPLVYLITDRKLLPPTSRAEIPTLIDFIKRAVAAGVDMLQVRERDLSANDLLSLTEAVGQIAQASGALALVNDRADVAASAGVGVHLTTRSLEAEVVRGAFGQEMLIGVSTHTLEEARAAESQGADFIVF